MAEPSREPQPLDNDAILAFVLGMIGMVACQLMAPVALLIGWSYYQRSKANGVEPHPLGIVGLALGAAGTVMLLLVVLMLALMCFAYAAFFVIYFVFVVLLVGVSAVAGM